MLWSAPPGPPVIPRPEGWRIFAHEGCRGPVTTVPERALAPKLGGNRGPCDRPGRAGRGAGLDRGHGLKRTMRRRCARLPRARVMRPRWSPSRPGCAPVLGLALLDARASPGRGLLIPRCRASTRSGCASRSTCYFLDGRGGRGRGSRAGGPRGRADRRSIRRAIAVLELPRRGRGWVLPRGRGAGDRSSSARTTLPTLGAALRPPDRRPLRALPAPRPRDALRLCRYRQPDLLLLDLGLPDASGLDVLRAIRAADG